MTNTTTTGLNDLQPDAPSETLKSRFFAVMPEIDAALDRNVRWEKILVHLASIGLEIKPELASNYAAQYRRQHVSTRTRSYSAAKPDAKISDLRNQPPDQKPSPDSRGSRGTRLIRGQLVT